MVAAERVTRLDQATAHNTGHGSASGRGQYTRRENLSKRSNQRVLPSLIVDRPTDLGSRSSQHIRPYCFVAFVIGNIKPVDDSHAATKVALRLNIHIVLAPVTKR